MKNKFRRIGSLALALLYGYHSQNLLDGGEGDWDPEEALNFARRLAKPAQASMLPEFYLKIFHQKKR